jgi:hypothetical protein
MHRGKWIEKGKKVNALVKKIKINLDTFIVKIWEHGNVPDQVPVLLYFLGINCAINMSIK